MNNYQQASKVFRALADIEFPSLGYIRPVIRQNKQRRQSKDVLKANREKYDVTLHQSQSV